MVCISGTVLCISPVLQIIATNSVRPPAVGPNEVLLRIARWLFIGGLAGTVLCLPLLILDAIVIGRLIWVCRTVVQRAVPSLREEQVSLDLAGDLTELGNTDLGGPSLPTFEFRGPLLLVDHPAGSAGLRVMLPLVGGTFLLMAAPMIFCLASPVLIVLAIFLAVLIFIYAAVHIPIVLALLMTIYRIGFSLNHVIDLYRLKVPWAPIGLAWWTAICGILTMAGPLSLAFFALLAIWTRRTSESAARICDPDSRALIAVPLPMKAPPDRPAPGFVMERPGL